MVTLLDVARRAKVSVATVSRVINGKPFVKQEVRERVNKACEELGYMKDLNAERLRRGVHSDIGIIASYPDWPIAASAYSGLYRASAIAGGIHRIDLLLLRSGEGKGMLRLAFGI